MHTLLIASQKGGVGKTTTAINLATLAAQSGQRVLILDADPLGTVATSLQLSRSDRDGKPPQPDRVTRLGRCPPEPGCVNAVPSGLDR